ncbi:Plasmid partition protein, ParB [Vibrio nigripulchritudo MADA3029]|nr:Plasmid partition protein, ParB [Vibrio nigripulchritudo AM115]CCN44913.1 Plasmid partition protein, ParB [Vibrio nigripulchritudo FTn2]CCN50781.1 Plasmid partition protein, ParB [Vibrio nigripulchritudo MADA3020]CCN62496.1 Plasmid partition protein, ParB [Vibrio nigripulchritudo MADA3029]CCN79668.1 Plasmid partition protein, ParB [Vibrio nigripulchritudo SO65]
MARTGAIIMAKKRGGTPLGNAPGAKEALQSAAKANIDSLTQQLAEEMAKSGVNTAEFLAQKFGVHTVGQSTEWTLQSGETAVFDELTLSYEQVRDETFVTFDINGRDQSLLTPESLEDLNSLEHQQYYPAVGRVVDGNIDVLDGSRRRAWFLLRKGKVKTFRLMVTKSPISASDAKGLAKQLQSAREHNQREIGRQCRSLMKAHGMTQTEVANHMNISRAAVGRALRADSIDERLISLFPVVNALSHTDYTVLDAVMTRFSEQSEPALLAFLDVVISEIEGNHLDLPHDEKKDLIIQIIERQLKMAKKSTRKATSDTKTTNLANFQSKGMFARKKVRGRTFSYEFGRLSSAVQEDLDRAVEAVLAKHTKE